MSSFEEISVMFHTESEKIKNLINDMAKKKPELSVHQIIETYYQIINVSSMAMMLKQQLDTDKYKSLLDRIVETENIISERFDSDIHPQILKSLAASIQETTKILQSLDYDQKPRDDAESKAKLYEGLREKMSTKEFVEQYGQGLSHG